jgi:hypothetical protein
MFDYQRFEDDIKAKNQNYNERSPYPYAYFDGLFDDSLLDQVNNEIDQSSFAKDSREIEGEEVKIRSDFEDNEALPTAIKQVFEIINGGKFLNLTTHLTGIKGLISDPYYDGGGVNIIENNGTLAVHIDGTNQHRMQVCRRINAILFLNDHWDPAWNGYHEQWQYVHKNLSPFDEHQQWQCVRKVLPKKNRLYIFTTNDHSWHGHAGVLTVPESVQRRSLITYYYTTTRPKEDVVFDSPHRALFINNQNTLKKHAFDNVEIIL